MTVFLWRIHKFLQNKEITRNPLEIKIYIALGDYCQQRLKYILDAEWRRMTRYSRRVYS